MIVTYFKDKVVESAGRKGERAGKIVYVLIEPPHSHHAGRVGPEAGARNSIQVSGEGSQAPEQLLLPPRAR